MKIIHFSDIHTGGYLRTLGALFDKRIIGTLNYKFRRRKQVNWTYLEKAIKIIEEEKPDFVINTGDLTSVSEPAEFKEALHRLEPLISNKSFQFLNVPGNHDFYTHSKKGILSRVKTYNELNRNIFTLESLPFKIETEDCLFIMVDESRPNRGINASGHLKLEDYEKISRWTEESPSKPVILVGHYPLKNSQGEPLAKKRALENSELLSGLLEKGKISVTLCGHIHSAFIREEQSGSLEICAGSLTIGGKLNKLEFNSETNSFSHTWIDLK
ncbi:MAG: metallophosphoesterase [Lentisphaeraceae bacterium]|nr:metallophosphoesterase [Lentisphaeraceae bacterium]